jgi:hypothetical protein
MSVSDERRDMMIKQFTYVEREDDEVEQRSSAPSWWHGDEDASVSSLAALGELTRR